MLGLCYSETAASSASNIALTQKLGWFGTESTQDVHDTAIAGHPAEDFPVLLTALEGCKPRLGLDRTKMQRHHGFAPGPPWHY